MLQHFAMSCLMDHTGTRAVEFNTDEVSIFCLHSVVGFRKNLKLKCGKNICAHAAVSTLSNTFDTVVHVYTLFEMLTNMYQRKKK